MSRSNRTIERRANPLLEEGHIEWGALPHSFPDSRKWGGQRDYRWGEFCKQDVLDHFSYPHNFSIAFYLRILPLSIFPLRILGQLQTSLTVICTCE